MQAADIRVELAQRMNRDHNSPVGGCGVWSLCYDTPQPRFYREKTEDPTRRSPQDVLRSHAPDAVGPALRADGAAFAPRP